MRRLTVLEAVKKLTVLKFTPDRDRKGGTATIRVAERLRRKHLKLTPYDDRCWRATFYTTGMEHSPTSATGTAWEPTPWHATQGAAWEALKKAR